MFKTLTLTALATALLFGAVPCEAAGVRNGKLPNGQTLNGSNWFNGMDLNGATWNGRGRNGATWNGRNQNGTEAGSAAQYRIIGVELPQTR